VLWFLLWFILVAAAVGLFAVLGLHLYRQAKALVAELSAASDRLGEISAAIADSAPPDRD
jgi:hypothetical protein